MIAIGNTMHTDNHLVSVAVLDTGLSPYLPTCKIFHMRLHYSCKVLSRLKHTVPSFRVSNSRANLLTVDPDLQALAAALNNGAAPELILLDLRENPAVDEALPCLVRLSFPSREFACL